MKRYYFAYGSNLSEEDRAAYSPPCPPGALKKVSVAFLPDRQLGFTRRSTTRGGGVLDVVPSRGCVVAGVLFEATEAGWAWLDKKEGSPRHYRHLDTVVLTADGRMVPVRTYEVVDRSLIFVSPADAYLDICRKAWEDHGLDLTALEAAAKNEPASPLTSFFVYGTLMRGESRHGVFAPQDVECMLLAKAFGRLVDCGAYPAMRPDPEARAMVQGDLIRVGAAALLRLIDALDDIEGFRGYGVDGSLFERRLTEVDVGEGRTRLAWVYMMDQPPDDAVRIDGNWRVRSGRWRSFLQEIVSIHCPGGEELSLARAIIGSQVRWAPGDGEAEARALVPFADALDRGALSERTLAQTSGRWVAKLDDP